MGDLISIKWGFVGGLPLFLSPFATPNISPRRRFEASQHAVLVLGRPSTAAERGPRACAASWTSHWPLRGQWGVPRAAPPFVAGNGGPRPRPLRVESLTSNGFARTRGSALLAKVLMGVWSGQCGLEVKAKTEYSSLKS